MNKLMLSVIRFSKVMEVIFLAFIIVATWVVVGLYITDKTSQDSGAAYLWILYFSMIVVSAFHFCFNNTFYNLRLSFKANGDFQLGKFLFDGVNGLMCNKLCTNVFCRDYQCAPMFWLKWLLKGSVIGVCVYALFVEAGNIEDEFYNDDEKMSLAIKANMSAWLLLAYLFQYVLFYSFRCIMFCFYCCISFCCGS